MIVTMQSGVCALLEWLALRSKFTVKVYTHQYLRHVDVVIDKVDDGRRNREFKTSVVGRSSII